MQPATFSQCSVGARVDEGDGAPVGADSVGARVDEGDGAPVGAEVDNVVDVAVGVGVGTAR